MGLAGPVRAAEHQQARGFAYVVERRRTAMRGPVDGAPGDVAGKAQGPFVLPVADERVEGPFFPKRHRVGHGGMEGVLPAFGSGLDEGHGGRRSELSRAVRDGKPFSPKFTGLFFEQFLEQAGEAYAEEGVGETDSQRSRFLIQQDFKRIKPALQCGFRARLQRFAGGGKAILKLGFGVLGVGEAGEQGRARLRDRFG